LKPTPETQAAPGDDAVEIPTHGMYIDGFQLTAFARHGKHAAVLQARGGDGSFVALKLATSSLGARLVDRETQMLQSHGDGCTRPRFVAVGDVDGRRYLASSWLRGTEVRAVASEMRDEGGSVGVLGLCRRVARAYASLHVNGVLHGHVHPRHVLVDGDESVSLLDFSLAHWDSDPSPAGRLAAPFNMLSAPEQAESLLRGDEAPLTAAAEQYSVAALLYLLLTGRMYARLPTKRSALATEILVSSPLAFADHALRPWRQCEAVLGRALSKDPSRRYASVDDLAQALASLPHGLAHSERRPPPADVRPVQPALAGLHQEFRAAAFSEQEIGRLKAPRCSVNFGAAGVAFALMRLGKLTGENAALEQAERWLSFAECRRGDADAFDDGDDLTPQTVGLVSPYHNASGVAAVRALLSDAVGDRDRQQASLDEFRAATRLPCANLDLTLGRSAVLLFAALLYARAQADWPAAQRLASYGDELCAGIWGELDDTRIGYHGIAHGWAGIAYATLMWSRAREVAPPSGARRVLEMLAAVAEPYERGVRWPLTPLNRPGSDEYWPGWCHGTAGYVFLWNLAADAYRDGSYAELAERAAWLLDVETGITSLCCGAAGQAYAALNHYRRTGEEKWRSRAVGIANRAASEGGLAGDAPTVLSLYKGHVGVALLSIELECPERAAMPLFEFEPPRA
jgi:hypothetical protein